MVFGLFIVLFQHTEFVSAIISKSEPDLLFGQSSDLSQKAPLVIIRDERLIYEVTVVIFPRLFLHRESNQISEPALWQCVLIGEESVIRLEGDFVPLVHGVGDQGSTEFSGKGRGKLF